MYSPVWGQHSLLLNIYSQNRTFCIMCFQIVPNNHNQPYFGHFQPKSWPKSEKKPIVKPVQKLLKMLIARNVHFFLFFILWGAPQRSWKSAHIWYPMQCEHLTICYIPIPCSGVVISTTKSYCKIVINHVSRIIVLHFTMKGVWQW